MKRKFKACTSLFSGFREFSAGTRRKGLVVASLVFLSSVLVLSSTKAQTYTVLYSFTGGADGGLPAAGLTRDASGNLYGTTLLGGASGAGVVFKL
jgi:hypothetical protein